MRLAASRIDKETKRKKLDLMAEALVRQGLDGDIAALKEIGDRMDGKATQQVEATITDKRMVEAPAPAKDVGEWAKDYGPH